MPNNAIPDELQGKNWFAHALALTTCLVHKSSRNLCQSTFLLQSCNLCIMQCVNCNLESIAGNLPEHTPAAYLGTFHAFLWPGTQPPPLNQITQQGCVSRLGLSWGFQKYIYILWKWPSKALETPPKFPDPPWTPPPDPLRIDSFMYQSIAFDVRIPNM